MPAPPPELTDAEYERRRQAVLDQAAALGLDAVAVTYSLHVEYLTSTWGSQFWVAPVILAPGAAPAFVVREFERDRVDVESRIPVFSTYFDRDDAVAVWADALRELGLAEARIGLELDNLDLTHRDVTELQRLLPRLTVVDASHVLPRITAVKSAEELAVMEASMRGTEAALEAMRRTLAPGVTEREVRAAMHAAALATGSPDLRGGVTFGKHSAIPHGSDAEVALARGDVAVTEVAGYCHSYCAALCRTAVLGTNPKAEALYRLAAEAVEAALAAMLPGARAGDVDRAARSVLERAGRADTFRHRTGYSNGIMANGRLNISLKPGADDVLEAGMTFHTPIILFEPGHFSVSCSESAVVTPSGGRPLSRVGRDLIRI